MTQTRHKMGSGPDAPVLVWDDITVPSRGAKLSTRLKWASGYVRRFVAGETATKKNLLLVAKLLAEAAEELP